MEFTHNEDKGTGVKALSSEKDSFSVTFWATFNEMQATLVTTLSTHTDSPQTVATARKEITELQSFVTAAAVDLPKYDLRRSQEEIDKLRKSVSAIEAVVQPKKKFSFRNKTTKKPSAEAVPVVALSTELDRSPELDNEIVGEILGAAGEVDAVKAAPTPTQSILSSIKSICIEDRVDEALIDITSEVEKDIGYQVYVKNCINSTISVRTTLGSSRLENLTNCIVFLGPCCTSTYVENCKNCIFFIRCHQLRIHHAYCSRFCVYVNSHPIIEDCSGLVFAPYGVTYPGLEKHLEVANLTSARNWDNVVDFRWHRTTPSPNWSRALSEYGGMGNVAAGWSVLSEQGGIEGGESDDEQ